MVIPGKPAVVVASRLQIKLRAGTELAPTQIIEISSDGIPDMARVGMAADAHEFIHRAERSRCLVMQQALTPTTKSYLE